MPLKSTLHHIIQKRTRQAKQNQPVNHQHRPEDRDIEDGEPGAHKSNGNRSRCRIPELEFRQAADEGTELLVLFCGEATGRAVFHVVVYGFVRGVKFGLEEGEEEV